MENSEKDQNSKMDIENQNHATPSSSNNIINSKNNQTGENNSISQLKVGEFILTPLEGMLLNKKMPHGFKFETKESILKSSEPSKIKPKRLKHGWGNGEHEKRVKTIKNSINESKNNNSNKEQSSINNKKLKKEISKDNSGNININNNSEQYKIMMKCYSGFNKIKSNPNSSFFYIARFPDSPSLASIEKKIKNFEYKTVNDFCNDLRKLWNYQFKNYAKEPNIYQNICKMSLLSDQICKELSNENSNENKKEEISNIKKRTDKIKKDLDEIKEYNQNDTHNKINKQKNMEEINHLGQLIRTLNKQQLKGIIPILSDKNESNNPKMFEFDLDQLSFEKFKKLEEYVLNCINKNKNSTSIMSRNNNSNNNINKDINKISKNNNENEPKDKLNINKKNNNLNNTGINKNINIKEKNINNHTKNHEKKIIQDNDKINKDISKENKNEEISNIKRKAEKSKKEMDEIKENNQNDIHNKNNRQKSMDEINHLGQLIRTLNKQQLKGIIPILSDKNEGSNNKMFEFNLEQLSFDKFKKLEDYVFSCINKNKNTNNNKNVNNNNKEINKNINDLNINKKNNNINKDEINNNNFKNIKEKNDNNNNNQEEKKNEDIKKSPQKKSFSDSDSMSSDSSLSN